MYFQSIGVPLKGSAYYNKFQEAVNEMYSAKKVVLKFQAKFFKNTCDLKPASSLQLF